MLSCGCSDVDIDDCEWIYYNPKDFSKLETKKRKRCQSCKNLIDTGSDCLSFERDRQPNSDIEERIHGDEVSIATWYMCRGCGEIFLNLTDAGFCLEISEPMSNYLEAYHKLSGFKGGIE